MPIPPGSTVCWDFLSSGGVLILYFGVYIATSSKNVYNRKITLPLETIYFLCICTSPHFLRHLFNVNRVGREIAVRENVVF